MSSFKEKSQVFVMGLMAGLIIAGGFFILKLDDYFKELNFYKNIVKTFTFKNNSNKETLVKVEDTEPAKEKKNKDIIRNKSISSTTDSNSVKKTSANFILDADTLAKHSVKDSVLPVNSAAQEDIVIRKDELLTSKTVEVINLNSPTSSGGSKDSLLQKVSGIKEDKTKQMMNVELWQSPLNYKGYKMGKYKIVLYGIVSSEGLKIYTSGNDTYLKYGPIVYKLENTSEFKPYERVTDDALLSKLK
jgi:hypothetical protein